MSNKLIVGGLIVTVTEKYKNYSL